MKVIFTFITILLITGTLYSQSDSTHFYVFWVRPYIENGITFPKNELINNTYSTNSIYHWGAGIRIGDPLNQRMLIYFQYSKSAFTIENKDQNEITMDSTLSVEEYIAGFNIILKRINKSNIIGKVGYIDASINNDYLSYSGKGKGFQVGLGYEIKIFRRSWIYVNYTYNFIKSSKYSFRDYDNQKITLGFML